MNIDINNIDVLVKMYDLGSVKSVASAQGKTSSAISKTLAKLKQELDDPLFVQTGTLFEPTSFLRSNIHYFRSVLTCINSVKKDNFDPKTHREPIKLYLQSYFMETYGAKLYLAIKEQAPHSLVTLEHWSNKKLDNLLGGDGNLAIHVFTESLPQSLYQQPLISGKVSAFVRKDHPAKTLEDLQSFPLAGLLTPGWNDKRLHLVEKLKNYGYHFERAVRIESIHACHQLVRSSDHFSFTTAEHIPDGTRIIPLPENFDFQFNQVMSYRRSQRDSPQMKWLAQVCLSVTNQTSYKL
ncbi:LysR family transcriptional regulator [Vibrio tapetis subsp. quintayensis]|uniref:LysR family transcriptional regulator n=1 Tax=Vibrio tapetis TaxID=52443 RepID=UPI0025B2EC1A|nr:LysR family transcriptional regulator [Vibrio tapetis]MDN3681908.1 LysR family transcriptional regulator [Vibrio tapetis subsp. quintayensis]